MFLEKQLYGTDDPPNQAASISSSTPPMSPLVKTVGNFLSYVPTQQAAAMQVRGWRVDRVCWSCRHGWRKRWFVTVMACGLSIHHLSPSLFTISPSPLPPQLSPYGSPSSLLLLQTLMAMQFIRVFVWQRLRIEMLPVGKHNQDHRLFMIRIFLLSPAPFVKRKGGIIFFGVKCVFMNFTIH